MATPPVVSSRGAKNQVRIRGPKPSLSLQCSSLEDMGVKLAKQVNKEIDNPPAAFIYNQFILPANVPLIVHDVPSEWKEALSVPRERLNDPVHIKVTDAVTTIANSRQKLARQRMVARQILKTVSKVDRAKYFEKEAWDTKHADGYRFKFTCRESYSIKEKALTVKRRDSDTPNLTANGNHTSNTEGKDSPRAQNGDHEHGKAATLDCKGSIFIKFSSSQQIIDVVYQHIPGHASEGASSRRRSRDGEDVDVDMPDVDSPAPPLRSHAAKSATITKLSHSTPPTKSVTPAQDTQPAKSKTSTMPRKSITETIEDIAQPEPKRRKRNSKAPEKGIDDSHLDDDALFHNGLPTPIEEEPTRSYFRKDISMSPSREVTEEHFPDDKEFLRPSIVTCVPSKNRSSSDDAVKKKSTSKSKTSSKSTSKDGTKSARQSTGGTTLTISTKLQNSTNTSSAAQSPIENGSKAPASKKKSAAPNKKRTKTGCITCRIRKLKCDEGKPKCAQCLRSKPPRDCEYDEIEPDLEDEDEAATEQAAVSENTTPNVKVNGTKSTDNASSKKVTGSNTEGSKQVERARERAPSVTRGSNGPIEWLHL